MNVAMRIPLGLARAHPWQFLTAFLGITLGVTVVVAVQVANGSARATFENTMQRLNGGATHSIIGGSLGVPERVFRELRTELGVWASAPVVEFPVSLSGEGMLLVGVDPLSEQRIRGPLASESTQNSASGAGPAAFMTQPGAVMLSKSVAARLDLQHGDSFELSVGQQVYAAVLVDIAAGDIGVDSVIWADIATAKEWGGKRDALTRIDLRVSDTTSLADIKSSLPGGVSLIDAASRSAANRELTRAFMTNLTAMSLLALLVSAFLIYNSFSFVVLQQRRMLGTLRALGVHGREILTSVLAIAAIIASAGILAGYAGGFLLAQTLLHLVLRSINDLYFSTSATGVSVNEYVLLGIGAMALAVALLAVALPALEATSEQPANALRRSALEHKAKTIGRLAPWAGGMFAVAGLTSLMLGPQSLALAFAALFSLLIACCTLVPTILRASAIMLQKTLGRFSMTAGIATGDIVGGFSRLAPAVIALMIAISSSIGVATMVSSFRASVMDWLDHTLVHDLYVVAPTPRIEPRHLEGLRVLPGVKNLRENRRIRYESNLGELRIHAQQFTAGDRAGIKLIQFDGVATTAFDTLAGGAAVLISEGFAAEQGLVTGDKLAIEWPVGVLEMDVVAIFRTYEVPGTDVMMALDQFRALTGDLETDSIALALKDGYSVAAAEATVREFARAADWPLRSVRNDLIRSETLRVFDQTFEVTRVLYWLTLLVAGGGVFSALLAIQIENRRQHGLLRALGLHRFELWRLILLQSGIVGLLSALIAIPVGGLVAAMLVHVINRRAFGWSMELVPDFVAIGIGVASAVSCALIAGLYPAWRAAGVWPGAALRAE